MTNQSFSLNTGLPGNFPELFLKIIIAIILVYVLIVVINFLRDKFIQKESTNTPNISDLLSILYSIFYLSGYGFIIGNILKFFLSVSTDRATNARLIGDWDYSAFGIILIFMGLGFKQAIKTFFRNRHEHTSDL